jgi:SAM-dependent methyltransferase
VASDYFWFRAKLVLIDRLLQLAKPVTGASIVNVGAGTGEETAVLRGYGKVITLDSDQRALALIDTADNPVCGDAQQLPFVSQSVDLICLYDVLEHLPDDEQAVGEFRRVLRPGGQLLLTVPAFPSLYSGHDRALGHYRRYNRSGLRELLRDWDEVASGWWSATTFLPFVVSRLMSRKRDTLDYPHPAPWLNRLLYQCLTTEARCAGTPLSPLLGSSLYAVFRKQ